MMPRGMNICKKTPPKLLSSTFTPPPPILSLSLPPRLPCFLRQCAAALVLAAGHALQHRSPPGVRHEGAHGRVAQHGHLRRPGDHASLPQPPPPPSVVTPVSSSPAQSRSHSPCPPRAGRPWRAQRARQPQRAWRARPPPLRVPGHDERAGTAAAERGSGGGGDAAAREKPRGGREAASRSRS